jgi:hypothetical protein
MESFGGEQVEHVRPAEHLGVGSVPGGVDESGELLVGDGGGGERERGDLDRAHGALAVARIGVRTVVAHPEGATGDVDPGEPIRL